MNIDLLSMRKTLRNGSGPDAVSTVHPVGFRGRFGLKSTRHGTGIFTYRLASFQPPQCMLGVSGRPLIRQLALVAFVPLGSDEELHVGGCLATPPPGSQPGPWILPTHPTLPQTSDSRYSRSSVDNYNPSNRALQSTCYTCSL